MMEAVLILNSDCSISALCEVEQYLSFQYQEEGRAVLKVTITPEHFADVKKTMWELRRNVFVLTPNATHLLPEGEKHAILGEDMCLEVL